MFHKYDCLIVLGLFVLMFISAMILLRAELFDDAKAQSGQTDVVMVSFPMRSGVYYQPDKNYEEEKMLRQFFRRGYEIEAVIAPTEPNGRPIVIFRR